MNTERLGKLEKRVKDKKWTAKVVNIIGKNTIETHFNSNRNDMESILHKIKLDLLTSLAYNLGDKMMTFVTIQEEGQTNEINN